jgi:hypothetical protein|eukprot:COSAG02_NODE_18439_length_938_cov_1.742551_1_plen_86_part_00
MIILSAVYATTSCLHICGLASFVLLARCVHRELTIGRMLGVDELLAFRKFFELRAPEVKVELLSLDLQPTWRPYVEAMGMGFDQW